MFLFMGPSSNKYGEAGLEYMRQSGKYPEILAAVDGTSSKPQLDLDSIVANAVAAATKSHPVKQREPGPDDAKIAEWLADKNLRATMDVDSYINKNYLSSGDPAKPGRFEVGSGEMFSPRPESSPSDNQVNE